MNQLHFPGDVDLDPSALYGADRHGAFYRSVSKVYDPESDTSTIHFKPIAPNDLDDFTADKMAKLEEKARFIHSMGGQW